MGYTTVIKTTDARDVNCCVAQTHRPADKDLRLGADDARPRGNARSKCLARDEHGRLTDLRLLLAALLLLGRRRWRSAVWRGRAGGGRGVYGTISRRWLSGWSCGRRCVGRGRRSCGRLIRSRSSRLCIRRGCRSRSRCWLAVLRRLAGGARTDHQHTESKERPNPKPSKWHHVSPLVFDPHNAYPQPSARTTGQFFFKVGRVPEGARPASGNRTPQRVRSRCTSHDRSIASRLGSSRSQPRERRY